MASKEMERVNTMLGVEHPFRIGDSIIDLYPVKLRDWEKFSETLAALELETLYQVYSYKDAIDKFIECGADILTFHLEALKHEEILFAIDKIRYPSYNNIL